MSKIPTAYEFVPYEEAELACLQTLIKIIKDGNI